MAPRVAVASPDGTRLIIGATRTFPNTESLAQASTEGGYDARWSRDGGEIFYRSPANELVAVEVRSGPTFTLGAREVLFSLEGLLSWDVGPDGRFLAIRGHAAVGSARQILVENFFEEIDAKVFHR